MKIIKIALLKWVNQSRDKRELSVCRELGMDVLVLAKGDVTGEIEDVDGYKVYKVTTRPVKWLPVCVNKALSIFIWAYEARKQHADLISGHNMDAVIIGWISNLFLPKEKKAKLVYDSHEYELGRNAERNRIQLWLIKHLEAFVLRKSIFTIVVNDSIADELQKVYRLKTRPLVVRSTPEKWHLDKAEIAKTRKELLAAMSVPDDAFVLMYHGGLMPSRNIEALIRAIARNKGVCGIILGNDQNDGYCEKLKQFAIELGISDRILFHPAVSHERLPNYIASADVGMILHKNYSKNAQFSLPNKFFENIQALTPLISTDMPSLVEYIKRYAIGITVDISDTIAVDKAIAELQDKHVYTMYKNNVVAAKDELCWENESSALRDAYAGGGGYIHRNVSRCVDE